MFSRQPLLDLRTVTLASRVGDAGFSVKVKLMGEDEVEERRDCHSIAIADSRRRDGGRLSPRELRSA